MGIADALFGTKCARCGGKRTKSTIDDIPTCSKCEETVLQAKADSEAARRCPIDGAMMRKEVANKLVIDRCPTCSGVWLDAEELQVMKNAASQEGYANGFVIGLAIG